VALVRAVGIPGWCPSEDEIIPNIGIMQPDPLLLPTNWQLF
jgi:hypothetical protein